jgi:hypothetical protein
MPRIRSSAATSERISPASAVAPRAAPHGDEAVEEVGVQGPEARVVGLQDEAIAAGFRHVVLGLPAPYPAGVARWVAGELVTRSLTPVAAGR